MQKRNNNIFIWIAIGVLLFFVSLYFFSSQKGKEVNVYFLKEEKLLPVKRDLPKGESPLFFTAKELTRGPSAREKEQGYATLIPANTRILKISQAGETAIVDFSSEINDYGGGAQNIQGMVGQIVFTFTSLPEINKVKILIDGEEEPALGGEGFIIEKALSREDLRPEKF